MMLKRGGRYAVLALTAAVAIGQREMAGVAQSQNGSRRMPVFEVDTSWPKYPNDWAVGTISSVAVDKLDHVWLLHRPLTVPENLRPRAAPPVMEFDANGRFVAGWGGEGPGYDWPDQPHGIFVDHKRNVWITGAGFTLTPTKRSDDMLLKFSTQGKLLKQIGGRTQNTGNADTKNLNRSADIFVNAKTNEAFVADGYGNRRVLVLDADSGAFKRMWGAFGNTPEDGPQGLFSGSPPPSPGNVTLPGFARGGGQQPPPKLDAEGVGSPQFSNPVHGIKLSNDGLLYVADRVGRRVQVFTPAGKYVNQVFINRTGPARESAAGIAFSPDAQQQFLYVADFGNSRVIVLNRKTLEELYQFGTRNETPGDFRGLHHFAADSKGNLYTAEVNPGNRAQRFVYKGLSPTPPANALTPAQLTATPQ